VSNLSPDEFVKLTLEHEGRFFSVVLAMLPGCADAEDIVQEAITGVEAAHIVEDLLA